MQILEAYDLVGSFRAAAELVGCDKNTVKYHVQRRAVGFDPGASAPRASMIDTYRGKVEELVDHSTGRIRADVVHDKLVAMGFGGSARTTRRAVAEAKVAYRAGRRRVYRPWIPEPGLWLQWDWGTGPMVAGRATQLWCAWLAWSRFRVVGAKKPTTAKAPRTRLFNLAAPRAISYMHALTIPRIQSLTRARLSRPASRTEGFGPSRGRQLSDRSRPGWSR